MYTQVYKVTSKWQLTSAEVKRTITVEDTISPVWTNPISMQPLAKPAKVTCIMTIDNYIESVTYDGKTLVSAQTVQGHYTSTSWEVARSYEFDVVDGAYLDVVGREDGHGKTCVGTTCSGFAMECQDTDGGAWDKFGTAADVNGENTCTASLKSSGVAYPKMSVTTSGFYLKGGGFLASEGYTHEKIWPADAKHNEPILFHCAPNAIAKAAPEQISIAPTVDVEAATLAEAQKLFEDNTPVAIDECGNTAPAVQFSVTLRADSAQTTASKLFCGLSTSDGVALATKAADEATLNQDLMKLVKACSEYTVKWDAVDDAGNHAYITQVRRPREAAPKGARGMEHDAVPTPVLLHRFLLVSRLYHALTIFLLSFSRFSLTFIPRTAG